MTIKQLKYQIINHIIDLKYVPFKILRAVQYGIKSWDIYDFDHSSVTKMTQYAMERLEPCIRNGYSVNCKKHAKDLRIMINLLDRMNNENETYYYFHEELDKKYPNKPDFMFDTDAYDKFVKHSPNYIKDFRRVCKHIDALENRDIEDFCRRFKKIRLYWD